MSELDETLLGGVRIGTLTEIAGPSGSGKTQLCSQLAIQTTLPPHLNGKSSPVLYIDTEQSASASRLSEIACNRYPHYFTSEERLKEHLRSIVIYQTASCDSLMSLLRSQVQEIIIEQGVKLLVIDSIASVVRKEFDRSSSERSSLLLELASVLKDIAEGLGVAVIVVNQVTTHIKSGIDTDLDAIDDEDNQQDISRLISTENRVVVALGTTWCHAVNTRITLQYLDNQLRQLTVAKSPLAPVVSLQYVIEDRGLTSVSDGMTMDNSDPQASDRLNTRDTNCAHLFYY